MFESLLTPEVEADPLLPEAPTSTAIDTINVVNASVLGGHVKEDEVSLNSELNDNELLSAQAGTNTVISKALGEFSENTQAGVLAEIDSAITEKDPSDRAVRIEDLTNVKDGIAPTLLEAQEAALGDQGQLAGTVIDATSLTNYVPTEEVKQDWRMNMENAKVLEGLGILGWTWDILGLVFSPDTWKDEQDLRKIFASQGMDLGEHTVLDFFEWYRQQPGEFRSQWDDSIMKAIELANDDNQVKSVIRTMQYMNSDRSLNSLDKTLDSVDIAGYVFLLAKAFKSANIIDKVKDVKNIALAAQLNAEALLSSKTAKSLKISKEVATVNVHPVNAEKHIPEATDGISGETVAQIEAVRKAEENAALIASGQDRYMKMDFLTEAEEQAQAALFEENKVALVSQATERQGQVVQSAERIPVDSRSFLIEYTYEPKVESIGVPGLGVEMIPSPVTETVQYKLSEVGTLEMAVIRNEGGLAVGPIEKVVASASQYIDRMFENAVGQSIILEQQARRFVNDFKPLFMEAFKTGSKKEQEDLSAVLLAGDEWKVGTKRGHVFTEAELDAGVDTATGSVKLDTKGKQRYFQARKLFDELLRHKNIEVRRTKEIEGYRAIGVNQRTIQEDGTPFDLGTQIIAKPTTPFANDTSVFVPELNAMLRRSDPEVQRMLDEGYTYWRADAELKWGNSDTYNLLLSKAEDARELPMKVVQGHDGYVLKENLAKFRFIRVRTNKRMNGTMTELGDPGGSKTIAISNSNKTAQAWARSEEGKAVLRANGVKEEHLNDFKSTEWSITGEAGESVEDSLGAASFGGVIGSPRASHNIIDLTKSGRIPAHEAASKALASVAATSNSSEWRIAQQERWMNAANQGGYLKTNAKFHDKDPLNEVEAPTGGPVHRSLMAYRDWLQDVMSIPSESEKAYRATASEMAMWMERNKIFGSDALEGVRNAMVRRAVGEGQTASQVLKGMNFHAMLGMFNPAQLFVQASQASVAFAMNPKNAGYTVRRGIALRMGLHSPEQTEALTKIAKAAGLDPEDYIGMVRAFNRAGMREGIEGNADLANAIAGYAIDAGAIKRVAEAGLIPFYEGELISRSYAFISRGRNLLGDTRKWSSITDAELTELTTQALRDTFMMHKNNRAFLQRGLASVPTQYWQIMSKTMEALMPEMFPGAWKNKKFTYKERRNIILAQLGLYGSAGTIGGNYALQGMYRMFGDDVKDASEEEKALLTQGLVGLTQQMIFGEQLETSSRFGLTGGILDTAALFTEDNGAPITEKMLGASFTTLKRIGAASTAILSPLITELSAETDAGIDPIQYRIAMEKLFGTFSFGSNLTKAYLMAQSGYVRTASGKTIADATGTAAYAQALGFPPRDVSLYYEGMADERKATKIRSEVSGGILAMAQQYYRGLENGELPSKETQDQLNLQIDIALRHFSEPDQDKIIATYKKNMKTHFGEEKTKAMVQRWVESGNDQIQARTSTPADLR